MFDCMNRFETALQDSNWLATLHAQRQRNHQLKSFEKTSPKILEDMFQQFQWMRERAATTTGGPTHNRQQSGRGDWIRVRNACLNIPKGTRGRVSHIRVAISFTSFA